MSAVIPRPQVTAFAAMAQTFKDVAHSHNKCQTCDRGFGSAAERQAFLAKQASCVLVQLWLNVSCPLSVTSQSAVKGAGSSL